MVGLFSSHTEKIQQGWKLLEFAPVAPKPTAPAPKTRTLRRVTPERLKLMIADYEAGMSASEIGKRYGHGRDTIMKHLAAAGIESRVAVPSDEEIATWRKLYAEGFGYKTIAKRVGRNHKTVRKYLI
jgi:DNA-directed RNA polymerase specialized sigma24 family protein